VNVSVSPAAQRELIDGARFYAERGDRELGLAFISAFEHARDVLSANPEIGAQWRGVTRRLSLRRFPYYLVYQIQPDEVRVIALAHQRRRPGYWAGRRW
jgi:plasmid stabilization system protein ParE